VSPRPLQKTPRHRRRVEVHYKAKGHTGQIGFSGNISASGMMLRTPGVHPPGTILSLEIRFSQRTIVLTGRVMWAREGPLSWLPTGKVGMGIKFVDPPADLVSLLKSAAAPASGAG